jgi:hypothetical protein
MDVSTFGSAAAVAHHANGAWNDAILRVRALPRLGVGAAGDFKNYFTTK